MVLTFSASGLPLGASFDPGSKTFSWTPSFDQAGHLPATVTFTVTDGTAPVSETIAITIANTNRAPVLAPIGAKSGSEGTLLTFTVAATDPDGDGLTFSASGLPVGASFDPGTKTFSWTPSFTQAGTLPTVTFTVTDGTAAGQRDDHDHDREHEPAAGADADRRQERERGQPADLHGGGDRPGRRCADLQLSGLPTGASFDAGTKTFSWTPSFTQTGTYSVTFTVT